VFPGGGIAPGSTPPDSAQTSGLSERQPQPGRRITPVAVASLVALAIFISLFVAAAVALIVGMH
jgi:hypothetical protein